MKVYYLLFTLVVIFNSSELSTQTGSGPSSPASSPERGIHPNMQGELDWKTFTFPAHNGVQYVIRSWLAGKGPCIRMAYQYEDVPEGTYKVQASRHEAYGFLLRKGTFLRFYVKGHQAAVSLDEKIKFSRLWHVFHDEGKPVTRILNSVDREYLRKQWPTGYY